MRNKLFWAEGLVVHSTFLFGAFATLVDYLHATPLPPEFAQYTMALGLFLSIMDGVRTKWKASLKNSPSVSSSS